jgi:hypothetical protein
VGDTAQTGRLVLAFAIAPLIPGLLIALAGSTFFVVTDTRVDPRDFFGITAVSAIFGYPVALILGAPLYVLLRKLSLDRAWIYALAGTLLGALLFALYPLFPGFANAIIDINLLPIAILLSVAATLTFWLIARPDRRPHSGETV